MRPDLLALTTSQAGLLTRAQALDAGCSERELRTLIGPRGPLVTVRRGVYVDRGSWDAAGPAARYTLTVHQGSGGPGRTGAAATADRGGQPRRRGSAPAYGCSPAPSHGPLRLRRHLIEFDGRIKYVGVQDGGVATSSPEQVLWLEKQREDWLRAQGYGMSRVIWKELFGSLREQTKARLHDMLRSDRLYGAG